MRYLLSHFLLKAAGTKAICMPQAKGSLLKVASYLNSVLIFRFFWIVQFVSRNMNRSLKMKE